jgi:hypothetical protein
MNRNSSGKLLFIYLLSAGTSNGCGRKTAGNVTVYWKSVKKVDGKKNLVSLLKTIGDRSV